MTRLSCGIAVVLAASICAMSSDLAFARATRAPEVQTAPLPGCPGRTVTRTGPTGITLALCWDGKYSTCVTDSQRLGYSAERAKQFCDDRKAKGFLRN
jgi:hypothetical protein